MDKKIQFLTIAVMSLLNAFSGNKLCAQTELISNGAFSSSGSWSASQGFNYGSTYSTCNSCPGYAYATSTSGSYQTYMNSYLEQTISIPSNTSSATLSFYVSNSLNGSTSGSERLFIYLYDVLSGNTTTIANIYFNSNNGYTYYSYSVPSSLFGKQVIVGFNAKSGSTGLICRVDDVSLKQTTSGGGSGTQNAPTNLSASAAGTDKIQLSWTEPSGAYKYDFYDCNGTYIGYYNAPASWVYINSLNAGTYYSFKMTATNSSGVVSNFTSCAGATTQSNTLTKPTGLTASAIDQSSIALSWNAVSGATNYTIYDCSGNYLKDVTTNNATITGLQASTYYSFKIKGYNSNVSSEISDCAGATTTAAGKPDLTVTDLLLGSNVLFVGDQVSGTVTIKNLGTVACSNAELFLSANASCNGAKNATLHKISGISVLPNQSVQKSFSFIIPNSIPGIIGNMQLKAWIDEAEFVSESNENNNLLCQPLQIKTNLLSIEFNPLGKSHLLWPFYAPGSTNPISTFECQNKSFEENNKKKCASWYYSNDHDDNDDGIEDHHLNSSYYAQDWNYYINNVQDDCNMKIYAPIGGIVVHNSIEARNKTCTGGCSMGNCDINSCGNYLIIRVAKKGYTGYAYKMCHLASIASNLTAGTVVKDLQYLGTIGSTGATGTHLHFSLHKNFQSISNSGIGSAIINGTTENAADVVFDAVKDGLGGDDSAVFLDVKNIYQSEKFNLYPNPAKDKLILESSNPINNFSNIRIFNTLGQEFKLVINSKNNQTCMIDISSLKDGIYYLSINGVAQRFVVQH